MARAGPRAVLPLCGEEVNSSFPKNSATVESSSKISPGINANPMLFLIAWLLFNSKAHDTSLESPPCCFQTKGAFSRKLAPSLMPVSRVLKADCSQLKSCRQKLLPCSTIYGLGLLDLSSLGRGAPALQAVELCFGVRSLPHWGTGWSGRGGKETLVGFWLNERCLVST